MAQLLALSGLHKNEENWLNTFSVFLTYTGVFYSIQVAINQALPASIAPLTIDVFLGAVITTQLIYLSLIRKVEREQLRFNKQMTALIYNYRKLIADTSKANDTTKLIPDLDNLVAEADELIGAESKHVYSGFTQEKANTASELLRSIRYNSALLRHILQTSNNDQLKAKLQSGLTKIDKSFKELELEMKLRYPPAKDFTSWWQQVSHLGTQTTHAVNSRFR